MKRPLFWALGLAFVASHLAHGSEALVSEPKASEKRVFGLLLEGVGLVPDPLLAPPNWQIEVGATLSQGNGWLGRVRLGGARRSLGTDLLALLEAGFGYTSQGGFVSELTLGAGLRQQFSSGDLYAVQRDGSVHRVTDVGTSLMLISLSGGVGYDFRRLTGKPAKVLFLPRLQLTLPQRDQVAVDLGVGLRLGWDFR